MLAFTLLHPSAGLQIVNGLPGKSSVIGELADGIVNITVSSVVGEALFLELADQIKHLRDVLSRTRLECRRKAAQCQHVFLHGTGKFIGKLISCDAAFRSAANDLIVNVGDVAHKSDFVARRLKPAAHNVKSNEGSAVADMAVVIGRHAADIHTYAAGFKRLERALLAREGRINRKHGARTKKSRDSQRRPISRYKS